MMVLQALVSRRRGRPSNRRLPDAVRQLAVTLVCERYVDFGPTLAAEKLAELHGCKVSRETLRQWMMADGIWTDRRHRLPSPHQPRRRRDCLGEIAWVCWRRSSMAATALPGGRAATGAHI